MTAFNQQSQNQQHLIIQPIEFDYKHRNMYGYYALAAFVFVLIDYIMLKERSCQISLINGFQTFDLIQGFHMTTLIVAIIVFVLSYFNFALVIYEFKLIFFATAAFIFACSAFLIYNAVAIVSAPCVSSGFGMVNTFAALFDTSLFNADGNTIFAAGDGVGITVFLFDILAGLAMFMAGRRFYKRC